MDAEAILLKCLKSKRFIDDVEKAEKEILTESVVLKKDTDLFIRDSISGMGTILKEDLEKHFYITTVKIGGFGNVITQAIIQRGSGKAVIAVYAHEGLFKRNLARKTIDKLKKAFT